MSFPEYSSFDGLDLADLVRTGEVTALELLEQAINPIRETQPLAHANDGGGSIRIPAASCGLVGLKPTRGRNSLGPNIGDVMGGLVVEHVVSRSVRDSAAALDATEGPAVGDPYFAPPKARPYAAEAATRPARLKIAFWTHSLSGAPIHEEAVRAVGGAAKLCAELGHTVEEAAPSVDSEQAAPAVITLYAAGLACITTGSLHSSSSSTICG